ncbi:hypothetical protein niasHT_025865 [Heterodera trifolii]|uniref:Protein root UVB sensitive/RUS domain-containing protein n=1 Tax=Heterodera trifolii TaxID=157864 RepID=A0ABD2KJL0_9BILA
MPKQSASQIEAIEQQQQNIVETYNGEPVHEYSFARPRGDDGRLALRKNSLRKRVHSVRAFFAEVFLPQGYPSTVSADYLDYQLYDTLQAFASSLNGTLATLAVLKGVGVGNEQATVLAAALTWILKDGVGMLARIAFAWAKGTRLDSDYIAFFGLIIPTLFYDLINPHFPSACFAPFACVASLLRSIVGVAGGATRMAIIRHQARRDNLADVAAKDGSQETLVNVLSLLFSLVLLPQVEGRPFTIWALFLLFTAVHLFANYRAVKCIQLETLNPNRLTLAVRHFIEYGTVPSIAECNRKEPILGTFAVRRNFGCPLAQLPANIGPLVAKTVNASSQTAATATDVLLDHDGFAYKLSPATICVVESKCIDSWLAIAEGASDSEIFDALFKMAFYAEVKRWPNGLEVSKFRHEMAIMGWSLQINQLDVDEWRYRSREKWT